METERIGAAKRKPPKATVTDTEPAAVPTPQEAAQAAKGISGPANDAKGANGVDANHEFDLDYTDSRGMLWTGHFKTHVLTLGEKTQVGLTRARLAGGVSPISLDPQTLDILEMQAHLAVALDGGPEWAKNLSGIRDINVLAEVYKEVLSHEERFWGTGTGRSGQVPGAPGGNAS